MNAQDIYRAEGANDRSIARYEPADDSAVMRRADQLMEEGGKFDPFSPDNFAEALRELIAEKYADVRGSRCPDRSFYTVGCDIEELVRQYWRPIAEERAWEQLEREAQ